MLHYFGILKPAATKPTQPGQQKPLFGGAPAPLDPDSRLSRAERSALALSGNAPGNGPAAPEDDVREPLARGRFVSMLLPPYF
jgi:hypothetical protein